MKNRILKTASLFLLIAVSLSGCVPGGGSSPTSKPARKKMLNMSGGSGWDAFSLTNLSSRGADPVNPAYPPLPFSLVDTVISLKGNNANFYVVRIPSSNMDFLLPMAMAYEPLLAGWMSAWPQTGRSGLAIDLSAGNPTQRSTLQVEAVAQHVSMPVVLLWDKGSESRATFLTQSIQSFKTLRCENLK